MKTTASIQGDLVGKIFEDCSYPEAMQAVLGDRLDPADPAWVMDKRNGSVGTQYQHSLWSPYFDTDMGCASTDKRIHLFPHSKQLRKITLNTKLTNCAIPVNGEDPKTFDRKDLILDRPLTEKEARLHAVLFELAESDQKRLDTYVENAYKIGKDAFGMERVMSVRIPYDSTLTLRAVVFGGYPSRLSILGDRLMTTDRARLIGIGKMQ